MYCLDSIFFEMHMKTEWVMPRLSDHIVSESNITVTILTAKPESSRKSSNKSRPTFSILPSSAAAPYSPVTGATTKAQVLTSSMDTKVDRTVFISPRIFTPSVPRNDMFSTATLNSSPRRVSCPSDT